MTDGLPRLLFEVGDVDEGARLIAGLNADRSRLAAMSTAAWEAISPFTWEVVGPKLRAALAVVESA